MRKTLLREGLDPSEDAAGDPAGRGGASVKPATAGEIRTRMRGWYAQNRRDLPWRHTRDPYRIWVSEIMLQQTRVETVIPYYDRFLSRFPTLPSLAAASLDDVLKAWENLGYYSRARHLHAASRQIVERHAGRFPGTPEGIRALPGVGPYVAGAVLSIAFGRPVPAVDGNVRRVLARLFAIRDPLEGSAAQRKIGKVAETLVDPEEPGRFNQALMELGARVCTPRKPMCHGCPLNRICRANQLGLQAVLPVRTKKGPLPHADWTAGIISDGNGRVLVVQRAPKGLLGGLWKLPGGEHRVGETPEASLRRNIREEVGIGIRVGDPIVSVDHAFTHFRVTLHAFEGTHVRGKPQPLGCTGWRWASPSELIDLAFSKVDRLVLRAMMWEG
jgi:A/G-specific adenine glycosylase